MPRNKSGRPLAGEETLTRELIIATALELVDRDGVNGLSMRKLAKALDVDPMAIYHYIPNKDALMSGIVHAVSADFAPKLTPEMDWRDQLRAVAREYRRLMALHSHLLVYLIQSALPLPEPANSETIKLALDVNEIIYRALLEAGVSPRMVIYCADMIIDFLHGYMLAESTGMLEEVNARRAFRSQIEQSSPESYPVLHQLYAQFEDQEIRVDFDREFDIVLAGIAAFLT